MVATGLKSRMSGRNGGRRSLRDGFYFFEERKRVWRIGGGSFSGEECSFSSSCFSVTEARPIQVNAKSAILIDMSDGRVLFEQNADAQIPPASITKVITLYLVFDAIKDGRVHLWDNVKVSAAAAGTGGSRMGLRVGRDVQLQELIRGAAVVSGNDACVALAEHLSGSVENFVRKMNAKARSLA